MKTSTRGFHAEITELSKLDLIDIILKQRSVISEMRNEASTLKKLLEKREHQLYEKEIQYLDSLCHSLFEEITDLTDVNTELDEALSRTHEIIDLTQDDED